LFPRTALTLGVACGVLLGASAQAADDSAGALAKKPNIIWLLLDACRAENLSCYGYERATSPNIDQLAERGVLFERNFAQSHCTNWSVSSYLTGRYFPVFALAFGSWRELWRTPPEDEKFLPQILEQHGYRTALFSTSPWITPDSRLWRFFQEPHFVGDPRKSVEAVNEEFFPWLDAHRDETFFAYLHLCETHFPHWLDHIKPPHDQWLNKAHPRALELSRITDTNRGMFSKEDQEYLRGLHDGSIHYEDAHIGRLVAKLESLGIEDDTIIIISADHGDALAEDGKSLGHWQGFTFEQVLRVPLIIAGPGFSPGRRVAVTTESVDIVPTLVDLLGIETSAKTDGVSLASVIHNPDAPSPHEYVFAKYQSRNVDDIPILLLQSDAYKYEWNPLTNDEHLWAMPDRLPDRVDKIAEARDTAHAMQAVLKQRYLPMWEAYASLARTSPAVFIEEFSPNAKPEDAWVFARRGEEVWTDNKWSVRGNYVGSCGWQEDAPPITFDFEVPNATYKVEMAVLNSVRVAPEGKPASCFRYAVEDGAFKELKVASHQPMPFEWWTYTDIGQFTISDGSFTLTLDEGDAEHWAVAQRLRFVPVEAKATDSAQDASQIQDQLRALGYLE